MNVGIDITPIIHGRGVSRYTTNLVTALAQSKQINLSLFGYSLRKKNVLSKFVKSLGLEKSSIILAQPQSMMSKYWRFGLNPIKKYLPNIDLFHSWDWLQPPDRNLPLVSTIHDVAMLKFPETAHYKILKMHKRSWKILQKRKAHIITVSRATKKDVVNLLGIPIHHINVVHEALPEEFRKTSQQLSEEEQQRIKTKLELDKPYLLFVGTREPRKNLSNLIKAWQPLAETHQLIIAGEKGWDETSKNLSEKLVKLIETNKLRFLGHVDDKELSVLYSEAEIFCYPSLYEGFGLPILEAFLHGTPVITSDISSMPEVAGNAAELVDPNKATSIRKGIETILKENKDQQRKRLQRMIIRSQMFSWERAARETIEVYKRALLN